MSETIPVEIKCSEHPSAKAVLAYVRRGDNDRTAVYLCAEDGGHYINVSIGGESK